MLTAILSVLAVTALTLNIPGLNGTSIGHLTEITNYGKKSV
jgi:hypothetical protein